MENQKKLEELASACDRVLEICTNYFYLWDEKYLENQRLKLFFGFIAQDETYNIDIEKNREKTIRGEENLLFDVEPEFVFNGRNFYLDWDLRDKGLIGRNAAMLMRGYGITSKKLMERFFSALKEPLGRYLAEKELKCLKSAYPAA